MTAGWRPSSKVEIVAGTPSGGGLDRVARALAKVLSDSRLVDGAVEVVNVPGDGARRAWTHYVENYPGDGHVIGVSSPNLTSDYLVGIADFEHTRYTPIATLVTEYIAFAVRADSHLKTGADLIARLREQPSSVTVALSTALGNPNHVALAKVTRQAGGDVNAPVIRVFDTALDAVADVIAGGADVGAVTAASVIPELRAGRVRVLGVSAPARLGGLFAEAPTWSEQGMDCVVGAWRGITGPTGITGTQIAFWQDVLRSAVTQPAWQEELTRMNWSPFYQDGDAMRSYLDAERREFIATLGDLGLLKAPPAPA